MQPPPGLSPSPGQLGRTAVIAGPGGMLADLSPSRPGAQPRTIVNLHPVCQTRRPLHGSGGSARQRTARRCHYRARVVVRRRLAARQAANLTTLRDGHGTGSGCERGSGLTVRPRSAAFIGRRRLLPLAPGADPPGRQKDRQVTGSPNSARSAGCLTQSVRCPSEPDLRAFTRSGVIRIESALSVSTSDWRGRG
jgi:hypothetical protein